MDLALRLEIAALGEQMPGAEVGRRHRIEHAITIGIDIFTTAQFIQIPAIVLQKGNMRIEQPGSG